MKRSDITTKQVLEACHKFHNGDTRNSLQILMDETGLPDKICYAAMEREDEKELIDYGVSLRTAWVTKEGYEFLKSPS